MIEDGLAIRDFLRKDLVSSKPQDYIEFLYMGVGFRLLSNDLNGLSPFP